MTAHKHKELNDLLAAAWSAWDEQNTPPYRKKAVKIVRQFLKRAEEKESEDAHRHKRMEDEHGE
jgi:uncharacterized membrane protein YccC